MSQLTTATHTLAARLVEAGAVEDPVVRVLGGEGWIGRSDAWLVRVVAAGDAVDLWTRPPDGGPWTASRASLPLDADADAHAEVEASVRAWSGRLTPFRLRAGTRYRVVRAFEDFYGSAFSPGEVLTFVDRAFLPYDDGHTLQFAERTLYVRGGTSLYEDFGLHLVET